MADSTGFRNWRFPPKLNFGLQSETVESVEIQVTASGFEYRNADWDEARKRWDASSKINTQMEVDLAVSMFRLNRGPLYVFRWKDWADYKVEGSEFGIAPDGINDTFDLEKEYTDGFETIRRRIVLPVDPTAPETLATTLDPVVVPFAVYVDTGGGPVLQTGGGTDYTVDYRNGRVVFEPGSIPPVGATLTWDGEFDTPVRFDVQNFAVTLVAHNVYDVNDFRIIEILADEILDPV